jgi:hypothetical protein
MTTYTLFMSVRTTPEWLRLSPADRFGFLGKEIAPILKAHPEVRMRFFDAEAFSARVSDMVVWETADLDRYRSLIDGLRETRFWDTYFEVVDIVPAVENDYASHYRVAPIGG